MRIMVIANPAAGGGRCGKAITGIQGLLKEQGIEHSFFSVNTPDVRRSLRERRRMMDFR